MHETITAAEANRNFSSILRRVREGQTFVVTSHGRPIAEIIPAEEESRAREIAKEALLARLERQPAIDIGHWTRDELYEDEE
jgi:prevent-host-death family protein